ncbi:uncharacterized protein F4807DRAFT_445239 [Annulohypoxylon truncatum]|uniref:uncharacterized protein n=1 Tax=Annulohypoxylon truncatum TaxID=327061 RepID=UPI002007FC4F|nr:uncharacterized protein F4807DRAFT_445239 [Annulohypoxylon truncatum]KAI1204837.1 hypothetical protein F4807DRAFT_445239 [Annulohypoxylon truncatum]
MYYPTENEKNEIVKQLLAAPSDSHAAYPSFEAYLNHYISIVCGGVKVDFPSLQSHDDVLQCVKSLYEQYSLSRNDITRSWFPGRGSVPAEREHILRIVVNVAFMIDINEKDYYPELFNSEGPHRAKWEKDQAFVDFLEKSFLPLQRGAATNVNLGNKKSLKAWKLTRRYGITIMATDNLLEHLLYNPKEHTLRIFHHISYLRSHLKHSKDMDLELDFSQSLGLKTLPPRLLFETLLSLQMILFPIAVSSYKPSKVLLKKCIKEQRFDKELLFFETVREIPPDFTFKYWAERIERLQEITERPPPRGAVLSWLERHTSERNALTIAIVGLFLSAFFGFLGVIIGALQLALAWLAWKYPTS